MCCTNSFLEQGFEMYVSTFKGSSIIIKVPELEVKLILTASYIA